MVAGCGADDPARSDGDLTILEAPVERLALVLASDHVSGAYAVVDLQRHEAVTRIELTHGDALLRVEGGLAYVINRLNADNIQVIDPARSFQTTAQWSVGPGTNPSDIALAGGRAFVPLYQAAEVAIHDAVSGERLGGVDLSELADADGKPELVGAAIAPDGRLLVVAQRLDWTTFTSDGAARLAVVDPDTALLITTVELRLPNPAAPPITLPGHLAILAWDTAAALDNGGVELVSSLPPYDSEVLVGEERFGGTLTGLATVDGDTLFVVASISQTGAEGLAVDTVLYRYVVSTDERTEVLALPGFSFGDIALTADGLLLICDQTPAAPGLRIFDAHSLQELTSGPIDTGLPPLRVAPLVSGAATR
jgi:hypothetical protein